MKAKPKVVYHGSQYLFDTISPQQAHGRCETESQMGIYAAATMEEVIPFALPFRFYPDEPGGKLSRDSDGINSYLRYGSINPHGKGYVYVLPSESFELVDEWQWVSKVPVKPTEVIEIQVNDYWHTITFSEEAKKIQRELYGEEIAHLELVIPTLEDMWFKESLMADEETMSYNHAWGGTIPFPKERWQSWYDYWIVGHENQRYYRYLRDENGFVGEIAYHFDPEYDGYVADVIIFSKYRGKGYGAKGLELLCAAAKENGISIIYDDIAIDNPAISLFLKQGFCEEYRTEEKIVLKKEL